METGNHRLLALRLNAFAGLESGSEGNAVPRPVKIRIAHFEFPLQDDPLGAEHSPSTGKFAIENSRSAQIRQVELGSSPEIHLPSVRAQPDALVLGLDDEWHPPRSH